MRIIQSACFLEDYIYDLDFCNVIDKTLTTSKIIDCLFDELEDQLRKMANEQISRDARIGLLIGSSLGDLNRNNADNPKAFNNHCFDSILHKVRSNYKNFEIF